MKHSIAIATILLSISCSTPNNQSDGKSATSILPDTVFVHDTIYREQQQRDWQKDFGLTHDPDVDTIWGKPVSWYLDDSACAGLASGFYYGHFRPSDDRATSDLLALATTDNDKLRPFYRWCLARTIEISDGALGELTGLPARRYAEEFPKEFIDYIERDEKKVQAWQSAISYSGFYSEEDFNRRDIIGKNFLKAMKRNCTGCDAKTIERLDRFAMECFE